jgi:hypothetical protein
VGSLSAIGHLRSAKELSESRHSYLIVENGWNQFDFCHNRNMHNLRSSKLIAKLVLVWFALFVGAAVASPLVNPEGVQLVCTTAGSVKLIQLDAVGEEAQGSHQGLHCPLCLPVAAPPVVSVSAPVHVGLSHALRPLEQARLASLIGLPWQARAPPSFS